MDKQALRKQIRDQKRAMTEDEIDLASARLGELFAATELYRAANTIYGYLPYNQEVRTIPMLEQAIRDGKRVAVPKVYGEEMRFIYVTDFDGMEKSDFGIPEPVSDGPVADDPTALVLMPGLAFDKDGHRVGYGGGFYDKFLEADPNHPTVALCYDFQVLPQIPVDDYDIPVDLVLWASTEE
jgi:5-formyltetrahydrofolate cyclo-ligase